jgi:NADH:ubiquinone reductase (H+-translocating)
MENNARQIVLIGGGYASIWAYRAICDELKAELTAGRIRIRVICPEDFHFFHGWTAESLCGIINDKNRMSPLARIFKYAEIIKGKASHVDTSSRIVNVKLSNGDNWAVPYDQLLLGMGSSDNTNIEGMVEHAYQIKSHNAYLRTKLRIRFLLNEAAGMEEATGLKTLRFVIAGSGFTGVEIAANLAEMLVLARKQYPVLNNIKTSIILVNSRKEILPGLSSGMKRMRSYAEKILKKYGIEIIHETRIIRVTSQGAYLSDGSFLESRMVISTIGQYRIPLSGTDELKRDIENRILTNNFLQAIDNENLWVAGDTAYVNHPVSGDACPSNALWAIKQGEYAGRNIARSSESRPLRPFAYKGLGQCASLGIGKGIGELYGVQCTGWIAWITRWFFFQYFMPLKKLAWFEIADWVQLLFTRSRKGLKLMIRDNRENYSEGQFQALGANQLMYLN